MNFPVLVAIKSTILFRIRKESMMLRSGLTYLRLRIRIRGRLWIPLRHQLTWWTSIWTVRVWLASSIRTQGPASVLFTRGDSHQSRVGREFAFGVSFLQSESLDLMPHPRDGCSVKMSMNMIMGIDMACLHQCSQQQPDADERHLKA